MRRYLLVALLASAVLVVFPGMAAATYPDSGAGVHPTVAWAGVGCDDLQFLADDAAQGFTEVTIKKPATGTYYDIALTVNGTILDWSFEELYAVILKGGSTAYVYNYSLSGNGIDESLDVSSDTGLTVPVNSKGIKAVTFCLEGVDTE